MQVKKKIQVKLLNSEKCAKLSLVRYSFKSYNVYTLDANMYF